MLCYGKVALGVDGFNLPCDVCSCCQWYLLVVLIRFQSEQGEPQK